MVIPLVSYEDRQGCEACLFEWADSYDTKDWARLAKCIAPTLRIDYRSFLDKMWEAMPAEEFVAMASNPAVLGNPLLKTQHFIGSSHYRYAPLQPSHPAFGYMSYNPDEIIGFHQLRVPHQLYTDASMSKVLVTGHAHSTNEHWYRRGPDGQWQFAGLSPDIRWTEGDFDRVFAEGRAQLGEKNGEQQDQPQEKSTSEQGETTPAVQSEQASEAQQQDEAVHFAESVLITDGKVVQPMLSVSQVGVEA